MKNVLCICLCLAVAACSGKLSEEDRKALHEEMENREIRQIRDEDIVTRAMELGRQLRHSDSLITATGASRVVYTRRPQNEILAELWEAYESAWMAGVDPEDNIQRDYPDRLIYTYASITPDSTMTMTAISLPKKTVVNSLH